MVAVVRVVALLLGIGAIVASVALSRGPIEGVVTYRHAPSCADGSAAAGCIGFEAGSVVDKDTYQTGGTGGSATDPPDPPETHYRVTIRRADGGTETKEVNYSLYGAAKAGDPAQLRVWQGAVVRVTVSGHEQSFLPPASNTLLWMLLIGWIGLGLLLWVLLGGGDVGDVFGLCFRAFGWIFLGLVLSWLPDVLLGARYGFWRWFWQIAFTLFAGGIAVTFLLGDDPVRPIYALVKRSTRAARPPA